MSDMTLDDVYTLDDFEALARGRLSHMAYEFLAAGAGDEETLRWNREAFSRIRLRPRMPEDVSTIDTKVELFGATLPFPILLAPIAYQRLFHPAGEAEAARGASAAGVTYVVSTATNTTIEEIAAAATSPLWLQIYIQTDRGVTRDLVARAEAAGVRALAVTVDTPVVGTRTRQARAHFKLPPELETPHLDAAGRHRLGATTTERQPVTWRDVEWLRSIAHVPVLLKGILTPEDAERAAESGADGVIVSNHGARNLDTVPATIDALPAIADRVAGRVPLLFDGGIRRGTDVVKALALGARAVLIGRPYAFALSAAGAEGVARAVAILGEELVTAMALLGRPTLAGMDRSVLW
jgi:4-hydroxymandelate oxidase